MLVSTPITFFSYSREDVEFALKLAEDLKAAGVRVWLDQLDIEPGHRWARAVQDALRDCPRVLVVLSPSGVNSTNVEDEVAFALGKDKTVIPVLYRDCEIPYRLSTFQYADFRIDYSRGFKVLLRTLGVEQGMNETASETSVEPSRPLTLPELLVSDRSRSVYAWGLNELVFDQEMLSGGRLAVSRASGIFPDGSPFDIPDLDIAPPSRSLAEQFDFSAESLVIYLTIPHRHQRASQVLERHSMRLLTQNENRDGCLSMPIGSVVLAERGKFGLNPGFVPPLLTIQCSDHLTGLLRQLIEILSAKRHVLASMRRERNQMLGPLTTYDIWNFYLLYTVNLWLPTFHHLFRRRHCHPEKLYSAMASLVGALTTFRPEMHLYDVPAYEHESLGAVFEQLDMMVRAMMETVVPTNLVSLPLKLVNPCIYSTAIEQDKYLLNVRMYLAVSAQTSQENIIRDVPRLLKVCSATHIESLYKKALPGIELKHLPAPPAALPLKLNYQYFSLNQSGAAWEAIAQNRTLAVYVPDYFPSPVLELLILLPGAD